MAQLQAAQPRQSGEDSLPGIVRRTFRCTSNGGEGSTTLTQAIHGLGTVLSAVAYSASGSVQIAQSAIAYSAKSTVAVTHASNATVYITVYGLVPDVAAAG